MERLPSEIQREIYEFARGDRNHWKRQHFHIICHLERITTALESDRPFSPSLALKSCWIKDRPINDFYIRFRRFAGHLYSDSVSDQEQLVRFWLDWWYETLSFK